MVEFIRIRYMIKIQLIEVGDIILKQVKIWFKRFWLEKSNDFFIDYMIVMGLYIIVYCFILIGEK